MLDAPSHITQLKLCLKQHYEDVFETPILYYSIYRRVYNVTGKGQNFEGEGILCITN